MSYREDGSKEKGNKLYTHRNNKIGPNGHDAQLTLIGQWVIFKNNIFPVSMN